ncbi:MAG: hypothetical protein IPG09_18225 [Ignavibacteria bacterium]|nr:hypothetical protein [Ignavibacteria bacterium]
MQTDPDLFFSDISVFNKQIVCENINSGWYWSMSSKNIGIITGAFALL